jgi:hypothetical protein
LRNTTAQEYDKIIITIQGDGGGSWAAHFDTGQWRLTDAKTDDTYTAKITMSSEDSWKLFSQSIRPESIIDKIQIHGNLNLAQEALAMVSFMA